MNNMTAMVSCFARAYHHKVNSIKIFNDWAAEALLAEDYHNVAGGMKNGIEFFLPGFEGTEEEGLRLIVDRQLSPSVLIRSAFCEEALAQEQKRGTEQYLILGAGYDTYGVRNSNGHASVFELDLPEILRDKEHRLAKAGLKSCSKTVACNLAEENWPESLMGAGFDKAEKAFVSILGLSYYLTKAEFTKLLKILAELLQDGSTICIDYPAEKGGREMAVNQQLAAGAGEEMKSRYSLEEMKELLEERGFMLLHHMDDYEADKRYCEEYNQANPEHEIKSPTGVNYLLAVRKLLL